jgi:hypothetical protein
MEILLKPGSPTKSKCDSPRAFVPDASLLVTPPVIILFFFNLF